MGRFILAPHLLIWKWPGNLTLFWTQRSIYNHKSNGCWFESLAISRRRTLKLTSSLRLPTSLNVFLLSFLRFWSLILCFLIEDTHYWSMLTTTEKFLSEIWFFQKVGKIQSLKKSTAFLKSSMTRLVQFWHLKRTMADWGQKIRVLYLEVAQLTGLPALTKTLVLLLIDWDKIVY